jgi:hypothetical protein
MRLSWFIASIATAAAALWGAQFALRAAPLAVAGDLPSPAALAAFDGDPAIMTPEDWLARRAPLLRAAFQRTVYGTPPDASVPHIVSRQLIDDAAFNELGRIEQLSLRFSGQHGEAAFLDVAYHAALRAWPVAGRDRPELLRKRSCVGRQV